MRRSLIAGPCEFLRNCYVNRELSLVRLKMFGEEKPGKVCNGNWYRSFTQTFRPSFPFSQVLI